MINLKRLGHVVLRVADTQISKDFYTRLLGLHVLDEEDLTHGKAVFLGLGKDGNTVDLIPARNPKATPADGSMLPGVGLHHFAFEVESREALRDAYFGLVDNGIAITMMADHVTAQSIYFNDPDGYSLEICWPHPDAERLWREGRDDEHRTLVFER